VCGHAARTSDAWTLPVPRCLRIVPRWSAEPLSVEAAMSWQHAPIPLLDLCGRSVGAHMRVCVCVCVCVYVCAPTHTCRVRTSTALL
jgi:hypothetical protein